MAPPTPARFLVRVERSQARSDMMLVRDRAGSFLLHMSGDSCATTFPPPDRPIYAWAKRNSQGRLVLGRLAPQQDW